MDPVSALFYALSYIAGLLSALFAVWVDHKLGENKTKKAFINELVTNATILKEIYKALNKGKLDIILPLFYTTAYEDLRRNGILYDLPTDLRNDITTLYLHIDWLNKQGRVMIYGLAVIKDRERLMKKLSLMINLIDKILFTLKKQWNL